MNGLARDFFERNKKAFFGALKNSTADTNVSRIRLSHKRAPLQRMSLPRENGTVATKMKTLFLLHGYDS